MSTMIERVAEAMDAATLGYSIRLTRLVDGKSTYTLTDSDRQGELEFPSHGDALEFIQKKIRHAKASAAIEAMRVPTEAMLIAKRKVDFVADGTPDDLGEWEAMIDAALKETV